MANIWKQNRDVTQKVKRNNHDLSFDNHATFKLGYLYPVFRKFVVPGDSFRIQSAFDLKLMPLVFPLQSRLRAHLHFFYVRYKNVWKDFEDYMTGVHRNTPLVEPYLAPSDDKVTTGSIYDFLGVPTTLVAKNPVSYYFSSPNVNSHPNQCFPLFYKRSGSTLTLFTDSTDCDGQCYFVKIDKPIINNILSAPTDSNLLTWLRAIAPSQNLTNNENGFYYFTDEANLKLERFWRNFTCSFTDDGVAMFDAGSSTGVVNTINNCISAHGHCLVPIGIVDNLNSPMLPFSPVNVNSCLTFIGVASSGFYEYKDLNLGLYSNHLPLKAMPFRCYESIYRAYYANDVLQPLIDSNGDPQYNKFCTNMDGGLDTTDYHLFKRNYELDFLTSAYPSPQAGPAPLVGISALGTITIEDENGITTAKAELDSDGNSTGISITSPLASVEHGRVLMSMAQAGFNINDFRSANSLQKLIEQTMRSGYRYIDYIKGQWGVKPKDQALDMPEFIGGFSRDVVINTITSVTDNMDLSLPPETAQPLSKQLGGFGGNGRVIGGSDFSVNKFCDDYGEIIGIMCVTPTPAYSQLLDKSMIAGDNYLSFPFPEFNQLGMQPIPYKEVAPIQAYLDMLEDPDKSLEDTFGYQRPNYNLVGSVDEVHGEFRGSLRNYLINRIFDGRPELGSSFIEIDPSEVNDVFVNQNPDDDVLIGHLRFKVDTKRPFPRIHMPGL